MVQYDYDAWGNQTVSGSNIELGNKNPFRYRSYFYDTETGLYFLKTRYYDPTTCRFLSRDSFAYADPDTPNGLNLYAYCVNNPVNYCDPSGHFALSTFVISLIIGIAVGAVVGGVTSGIAAANEGRTGVELFASIAAGVLMGGAMGAAMVLGGAAGLAATGATVAGFGMTAVEAAAISVGIGAFASTNSYLLVNTIHSDKNVTFGGVLGSAISGGLQGFFTFGVGFIGGYNGLFNKLGNFKTMDAFYLNMLQTTGKISSLSALFYGTSMLIGDTLTKSLYLSSLAAGGRALIKFLFSFF